jgi:hypothetical protein
MNKQCVLASAGVEQLSAEMSDCEVQVRHFELYATGQRICRRRIPGSGRDGPMRTGLSELNAKIILNIWSAIISPLLSIDAMVASVSCDRKIL